MTTKTFARNMGQLRIDPDQSGLVAGYDMVPRADGMIEDLSGNGNHGTINGPAFEFTEIGPSMKFDGVDDYIDCGVGFQALTDVSVCFWFEPELMTGSKWILDYHLSNANEWGLRATLGAAGYTGIEIYDDIDDSNSPLYNTALKIGVKHFIVAQMDGLENKLYINEELVGSGISASNPWSSFAGLFYIGSRTLTVGATPCSISNVKIFNRAITQAEIQAEHQAGAKAVNFKTEYGAAESAAAESAPGELSNTPFRKESGTHKISTDTINGKTCKVIECVTSGVVQIPTAYFHGDDTQAAHGSFEWWIYQSGAVNFTKVAFIANQNTSTLAALFDGYVLRISAAGQLQLIRRDGGSQSLRSTTVVGYVALNTWNKYKVTISTSGEFTSYLNDVLVDTTGGSGTNPTTDITYTESKHMVLDILSGDKVAYAAPNGSCAIVKYEGIV